MKFISITSAKIRRNKQDIILINLSDVILVGVIKLKSPSWMTRYLNGFRWHRDYYLFKKIIFQISNTIQTSFRYLTRLQYKLQCFHEFIEEIKICIEDRLLFSFAALFPPLKIISQSRASPVSSITKKKYQPFEYLNYFTNVVSD